MKRGVRMTVKQKPVTAEELLRTPNYGLRRELVRGEVRTMAPAGYEHGRVAHNLALALGRHVHEHNLGALVAAETGFKISGDPDTVRAPDVAFVSRERAPTAGAVSGFWPNAPDLVAEVVSPNDTFSEVEEKVEDWLAAGVRMVLVVNPRARTVTVRLPENEIKILTREQTIDGGEVVPGWTLPVADVFG